MSYYQNCKIKQSLHIYSSEKLPGAECHAESKAKALLTRAVFNPATT